MAENKTDWITPLAVASGIGLAGVGAYMFLKGKEVVDPGTVQKQGVVYNDEDSVVYPGQPVSAEITWQNIGESGVRPRFRVDIEQTGWTESPLEGAWATCPEIEPDQPYTFTVTSRQIPLDWAGKDMRAYVMLEGVEGHWDESGILAVYDEGGSFTVGAPQATPEAANVGEEVQIALPITSNYDTSKQIRVVIKIYDGAGVLGMHGDLLDTKENTFTILPGQSTNCIVYHTASEEGASSEDRDVGWELYLDDVRVGDDEYDNVFRVKHYTSELYATYNNGVVTYTFRGFQPYAVVRITIVEIGNWIDRSADSYGEGNGSIAVDDPPGDYTLQATDSYGNDASDTYTIPAPTQTSLGVAVDNAASRVPGADQISLWYEDPVRGALGDGQWHPAYAWIDFEDVNPGGYFSVNIRNSITGAFDAFPTAPVTFPENKRSLVVINAITGNVVVYN